MGRLKSLPPRLKMLAPRLAPQAHSGPARDQQRMASAPWRAWYKTARWRRLRIEVFTRDLFTCQREGCGRLEPDTSKLVCDHVRQHHGDETAFWRGPFQTLCKRCHDSVKQAEERGRGW